MLLGNNIDFCASDSRLMNEAYGMKCMVCARFLPVCISTGCVNVWISEVPFVYTLYVKCP